MAHVDYENHEECFQNMTPQSPSSRNFAAFAQYSQENLPRRVREAFEAMLDEQLLPIEESLKRAIPEVVRTCQAQIFRDWEQLSSRTGETIKEGHPTQGPQTEEPAGSGNNSGRGRFASTPWDESLSKFFIEPEPVPIDNPFEDHMQLSGNGEGPSRTTEDSGYHSLRRSDMAPLKASESLTLQGVADDADNCAFQEDLEEFGLSDADLPAVFDCDWSSFLLDHGDNTGS
jgi:hypothetical protein